VARAQCNARRLMTITTDPLRRASPYLLLTLVPFFWSCNWILGRGLHEQIPPLALTFYRWLFALVILAPFALPGVVREWPAIRRGFKALLPLGVIGIGSHNALAYIGLNYTTATNGVLLNSSVPIIIIALSFLLLRVRLSGWQTVGVTISVAGVLAILSRGSWEELRRLELNRGDVFVLLSMLLWSLYTIGLRWRPPGLSMLSFLYSIAVIGTVAMLPCYLAESALGRPMTWSLPAFGAIAFVAVFSSVLSYIFWYRGVEQVGANVAGLFVHLMPVFGTLLAWLFLGERLLPFHVAGMGLILTGIWLTTRSPSPAVGATSPR
jgi:drug/metabolite transporter (DMT)-like permease